MLNMCRYQLMISKKSCPIFNERFQTLPFVAPFLNGHYLEEGIPKVGVVPREGRGIGIWPMIPWCFITAKFR